MSTLLELPLELLDNVSINLSNKDLSSLSRCNKALRVIIFDRLFSAEFPSERAISRLFMHAARHDSANIVQSLIYWEHGVPLRRGVKVGPLTYLHYLGGFHLNRSPAYIVQDAPTVANQLVRYGTDAQEDVSKGSDVMPACLALAQPSGVANEQTGLNNALRLPLAKGADSYGFNRSGLAPIHPTTTTQGCRSTRSG